MAQPTRRELIQGHHQGTRQELLRGRPEQISKVGLQFTKDDPQETRIELLRQEVNNLWGSLRGGGESKTTRNPDMRLGQCLDQFGRVVEVYTGTGFISGSSLSSRLNTLETNEEQFYIPAQCFTADSGATNPAVWTPAMGGSRLSAWAIVTGSTNIYFWHGLPTPNPWDGSGKKVLTRLFYEIDPAVAEELGHDVYVVTSGYAYNSGDLTTSPTIAWNETMQLELVGTTASAIYYQDKEEAASTLSTSDFIGVRINFNRANASYTYTGTIYFHGVQLELVDA